MAQIRTDCPASSLITVAHRLEAVDDVGASRATELGSSEEREPDRLLLFSLCMLSFLCWAGSGVFSSTTYALQHDVGLALADLATIQMAESVCANVAGPLWGILADRAIISRRRTLIMSSLGHSLLTCLFALANDMATMVALRSLSGVMLSAQPVALGILSEKTSEGRRGRIFGVVQSSGLLGMVATVAIVVPIANLKVAGLQGWRVMFVIVGFVSMVVSALVGALIRDPAFERLETENSSARQVLRDAIASMCHLFRIPSYIVMLVLGILGSIPGTVVSYATLWLQLRGVDDSGAAVLTGTCLIASLIGNILGGYVGDGLTRKLGLYGRPLTAQISGICGFLVACAYPLVASAGLAEFWTYFVLISLSGLLSTWAPCGTDFPVISEIVPRGQRTTAIAWQQAIVTPLANAMGPSAVATLARGCFGYRFGEETRTAGRPDGPDLESAQALGKALLAVVSVTSLLCFFARSLLYWSFPRDVRRVQLQLSRGSAGDASKWSSQENV